MDITEDYVSFETANLLKKKKFNEPCRLYYDKYHGCVPIFVEDSKLIEYGYKNTVRNDQNSISDFIATAPSLYVAMKWLRENFNCIIEIRYSKYYYDFYYIIYNGDEHISASNAVKSYEEACEAAIKYCLENLI